MPMHSVLPMLFALLVGGLLPAVAGELEQKAASHRTVTAFFTEHGRATASTFPRPVACKADGSACAADGCRVLQRCVQADWRRTQLRIQ